jgi:hypothetical protein
VRRRTAPPRRLRPVHPRQDRARPSGHRQQHPGREHADAAPDGDHRLGRPAGAGPSSAPFASATAAAPAAGPPLPIGLAGPERRPWKAPGPTPGVSAASAAKSAAVCVRARATTSRPTSSAIVPAPITKTVSARAISVAEPACRRLDWPMDAPSQGRAGDGEAPTAGLRSEPARRAPVRTAQPEPAITTPPGRRLRHGRGRQPQRCRGRRAALDRSWPRGRGQR